MFKCIVSLLFGFIVSLMLVTSSQANDTHGIDVSGYGAVDVVPDQFSLTLSISERGLHASKTKLLVDHKTDQVVTAAKKLGIKEKNIQTAQLYLHPIYEPRSATAFVVEQRLDDGKGNTHVPVISTDNNKYQPSAYNVSRQVQLVMNDIQDYDKLLEVAVRIGVSNISPLQMTNSTTKQAYQQALDLAILDAKNKASHIAKQAGYSLGKMLSLVENSYGHSVPRSGLAFSAMQEMGSPQHESRIGSQQITANVRVKFAIND